MVKSDLSHCLYCLLWMIAIKFKEHYSKIGRHKRLP